MLQALLEVASLNRIKFTRLTYHGKISRGRGQKIKRTDLQEVQCAQRAQGYPMQEVRLHRSQAKEERVEGVISITHILFFIKFLSSLYLRYIRFLLLLKK